MRDTRDKGDLIDSLIAFFKHEIVLVFSLLPPVYLTTKIRGLSLARSWRMLTMVDNSLRWLTRNRRNEGELTPKY